MMQTRDTNRRYLLALIACWIISRLIYLLYFGLRIDIGPLSSYLQYIDPALLRTSLLQSTFYLREQPPGFNLFLGIVLKIFGDHAVSAFQACYLGCGIGLAVVLFLLLRRLGALPPIAFFVAALFCLSPITILYENWLFYTYPLTFLLSLSALFLLRYRESARTLDAAVFFWILAAIVMSRGIFHAFGYWPPSACCGGWAPRTVDKLPPPSRCRSCWSAPGTSRTILSLDPCYRARSIKRPISA